MRVLVVALCVIVVGGFEQAAYIAQFARPLANGTLRDGDARESSDLSKTPRFPPRVQQMTFPQNSRH